MASTPGGLAFIRQIDAKRTGTVDARESRCSLEDRRLPGCRTDMTEYTRVGCRMMGCIPQENGDRGPTLFAPREGTARRAGVGP